MTEGTVLIISDGRKVENFLLEKTKRHGGHCRGMLTGSLGKVMPEESRKP